MALYLISYDIAEKDAFEYEDLWARLKEIGATKILYSEWVVEGSKWTARNIYDSLAPLIEGKDRLLVQEVTRETVWDRLLIGDNAFKELLLHARS